MPSATSRMPSPLKSPAATIWSPTLAAAGRLPMRTFDSVRRSTEPPALSGPDRAWGAIAAHSAAVTPAHASARRLLVFSTAYPSLGRFLITRPVPAAHHARPTTTPRKNWPFGGTRTVRARARADVARLLSLTCERRPSRLARIQFTSDEEEI